MTLNSETEAQIALQDGRQVRVSDTKPQKLLICPLCEGGSSELFQKNGHMLHECQDCGHRFVDIAKASDHVARVYSDEYFNGVPGGYPDYLVDDKLLIAHGRRYAGILDRYMEPGSILDVGAAAGFILKGFEEMGWKGEGIEPNSTMAEHARDTLNISVVTGALETHQSDKRYDVISMIQIISHFVDLERAFAVASNKTKPGGYWLVETWNRESRTARILGERWHEYDPPSVLHWFSIESLREFVESFGMREVAHGRPTKRISVSHARSVAQGELGGSRFGKMIDRGVRILPERLLLPYMFDDIFWALYRKPLPCGP